jgi:para-nitrobenzyl esterase
MKPSRYLLAGVLVISSSMSWSQEQAAATANGPVVQTQQGRVQGVVSDDVVVYKGLPFAAPPVGDLRWREPQAPTKWSNVKEATTFGGNCQRDEDCLYLNIYAPAKTNGKLPVMVWIHGGAFIFGSGSTYDGTQFAKQDVIVVTVNYRLGRAGWFAHPALSAEDPKNLLGNYGLMDQIAALEWVRGNIEAFGGDAKNVTAFGESAGAISINYLMLAPQARGLFHKAISQSGFGRIDALPLRTTDGTRNAEQIGARFAEKHGISGSNAAAAKALRAIPWVDLIKEVGGIGSGDQPLPMADGKIVVSGTYEGFAKGNQARVPFMLGGNSDEASLYRRSTNPPARMAAIKERRDDFVAAFDPKKTGDVPRVIARLITDESISEPDRALARLHSKLGLPTYVYHFSYVPASMRDQSFGMPHGGEISYVFNTPRAGGSFDQEGQAIASAANKYWVAFAKHSDPDSAGGPTWPKFDSTNESLIEFGAGGKPVVHKHFHKQRLDWVEQSLSHE